MKNVHVSFKVEIEKNKFSYNRDERGEASLEFDIPVENILTVDFSPLLQSLLSVAYANYTNPEEDDE